MSIELFQPFTKEIQEALTHAEQSCFRLQATLTPLRKLVLSHLYREPKGLKAYEILDLLMMQNPRSNPTTVYRALDFLMAHGLVRKISRVKIFKACTEFHNKPDQPGIFLVCGQCHSVTEMQDAVVIEGLVTALSKVGHKIAGEGVEIGAICPSCICKVEN